MPQANNRVVGDQWDTCDQCGFTFPNSQLVRQKGRLVCTRPNTCLENLEVERRPFIIEQVVTSGNSSEIEGADLRNINRGFFEGFDEGR